MDYAEAIKIRLDELEKEKGITRSATARKAGISRSSILNTSQGKTSNIILSTIVGICAGYEISLSEFFDTEPSIEEIEKELKD